MTVDETEPMVTETKLQRPLPSAATATATIAAGTVANEIEAMSMKAKLQGPRSSPPPPSTVPAAAGTTSASDGGVADETEATVMEVKPSSPVMEVKPSSPPPLSAVPPAAATTTTAAADGGVEKKCLVGEIENLKLETKKRADRSIDEESDGDRSQHPPGPDESRLPGDGAGAGLEKSAKKKPVEGNIRVLEADSVFAAENNAPVEEGNRGADLERKPEERFGGVVDGGVSMVFNGNRDPAETGVEAIGYQEKKGKQNEYWGSGDKCMWRKKNEEGGFEDKSRGKWPENQNRLHGKMGRVGDEDTNVWNSEEGFNVHGGYGHKVSKYYEVFEKNSPPLAEGNSGKFPFPQRPGKPNCVYYLKTGKCGYGTKCMFNHPPDRKDHQVAGEQIKDHSETECKFYLLPGGCMHGDACRYRHGTGQVELNFSGLPLRPGQRECQFYMRTGTCKYSTNCYFHHPEPTAAAEENSSSGYENDELPQKLSPGASQFSETFQTMQLQSKEPTSFSKGSGSLFPAMLFPPQKLNPWEDDQVPINPLMTSKGNMQQPSTFNHATDTDDQQTPMKEYPEIPESDGPNYHKSNTEYPERFGEQECSFFMKNGYCIFRSSCIFHHPKSRPRREPPFTYNPDGLPIRNDQPICLFYSRVGICKYGPACKFSHPVDFHSRTSVPEENTATKEEW